MRANYPNCLSATLREEGGYSNNPADPGGATDRGVTQARYDAYRKRHGQATQDVRKMTDAELAAIYSTYWVSDEIPDGPDLVQFDAAVNSGLRQSVKWLQRAAGAKADGIMGPATLTAIQKANRIDLIENACKRRLSFMQVIRDQEGKLLWAVFGKGWSARVARIEAEAIAMASGSLAPEVHAVKAKIANSAASAAAHDAAAIPVASIGVGAVALQAGVPIWAIAVGVAVVVVIAIMLLGTRRAHLAIAQAHTEKLNHG